MQEILKGYQVGPHESINSDGVLPVLSIGNNDLKGNEEQKLPEDVEGPDWLPVFIEIPPTISKVLI